jgi:hypothetical protein
MRNAERLSVFLPAISSRLWARRRRKLEAPEELAERLREALSHKAKLGLRPEEPYHHLLHPSRTNEALYLRPRMRPDC